MACYVWLDYLFLRWMFVCWVVRLGGYCFVVCFVLVVYCCLNLLCLLMVLFCIGVVGWFVVICGGANLRVCGFPVAVF